MLDAAFTRIQVIKETAIARGVVVHLNARGDIKRIGAELPKATALAEEFLTAGSNYKLLSAVTHSQGAFILATSFRATARKGHMEKSLNTDVAVFLLIESAVWFAQAAGEPQPVQTR